MEANFFFRTVRIAELHAAVSKEETQGSKVAVQLCTDKEGRRGNDLFKLEIPGRLLGRDAVKREGGMDRDRLEHALVQHET